MSPGHHSHGGRSSQGTFDPMKIFNSLEIKKGSTILDAGCGDGYMSMILSGLVGDAGIVHSFDIFQDSIKILEKRIENGNYNNINPRVQNLIEPLPLEDSSIDIVMFTNVFHGFVINGETEPILDMIKDKLNPSGRIIIVEFQKIQSPMGPDVSERIGPEDLQMIFKGIGLEMERTAVISESHYFSVFSRKNTG